MGLLDDRVGKKFRVLYVTPEGREYWMGMTSVGSFGTDPPFIIHELPDGTFEAAEVRYSSLHDFAAMHGCYYDNDLTSVDPMN